MDDEQRRVEDRVPVGGDPMPGTGGTPEHRDTLRNRIGELGAATVGDMIGPGPTVPVPHREPVPRIGVPSRCGQAGVARARVHGDKGPGPCAAQLSMRRALPTAAETSNRVW